MHGLWRTNRAMLVVGLVLLAIASVQTAVTAQSWTSYIISEDVMYWIWSAETGQYYTTDSVVELPSRDVPLVKVQQTVYNQDYTGMLKDWGQIPQDVNGYLYAYSVSNLNVLENVGDTTKGIREFHVDWQVQAVTVTTSPSTPLSWSPFWMASGPTWMYRGSGQGLMPGETVGGLWAFAPTGNDGLTDAVVKGFGEIVVTGKTTGPVVPEPASFMALLTGIAGLAGYRIRNSR